MKGAAGQPGRGRVANPLGCAPTVSTSARPTSRLVAVRARNYLAFGGNHTVDLQIRPLTLIFGRNSSGKTALMRLIRIALRALVRPLADDNDAGRDPRPGSRHLPLRIDDIVVAATFRDLVHGRFSKAMSLGLDLEVNGAPTGFDVDLLPADAVGDRSWMVRFAGRGQDAGPELQLDLHATFTQERAVYRGESQPKFEGLRPAGTLDSLRRGAGALDAVTSHLGPLRARVPNAITRVAGEPLGYDGAGAPHMIADDDELAARVDDWYASNLGGSLKVRPLLDTLFEVTTTAIDGTVVNLAQAGEGLHQVLPIVVQQLSHIDNGNPHQMLDLVEQPELHLHDAVHAPLGDLFMATARLGRGAVIVETHSEGLLLRVRRRIAEGTFDPKDVAVYFVDRDANGSYVRSIPVNQDGEMSEWPEGVFLENYREVLAIQRAIRSR